MLSNVIKNGSQKAKLKTIGTIKHSGLWHSSLTKTFNVASVYSAYDKLTVDDFAIPTGLVMYSYRVNLETNAVNGISKSYDASKGILTLVFKQIYDAREYKYGYDFTFPIIILDRFNVGGVISQLITHLANILRKEVLA